MKHTFLFEEGRWQARGTLSTAGGGDEEVCGVTTIRHTAEAWLMEARMGSYENRYRIEPFAPERPWTPWSSRSPAAGRVRGRFSVVDDSILSMFTSDDGRFAGFEYLRRISDDCYECRGSFFKGPHRVSAWTVRLSRAGGDPSEG